MEYTSTSSPLAVPCSVSKVRWEQIKSLGLREGHWQFFPASTSHLVSAEAQRLFTLSLEEPVSWKPNQTRGLTPVPEFKNQNLSLRRTLGRADDRGDYMCTLKFDSGVTLSTTVGVEVLESKSVQTGLSAPLNRLQRRFLDSGGRWWRQAAQSALLSELLTLLGCPSAQFESS